MSRRAKPAPAELVDKRGVRIVSISTATRRGFAGACLDTLTLRDGRARRWLLGVVKSIDVPADVVEETRLRLSHGRADQGSSDPS